MLSGFSLHAVAQDRDTTQTARPDTVQAAPAPADTSGADPARADTTRPGVSSDSLRQALQQGRAGGERPGRPGAGLGGERPRPGDAPSRGAGASADTSGALSAPVTLTSRDSLVITFDEDEGDVGMLYGNASMQYEDASLNARIVEMNFDRDQIEAYGNTTGGSPTGPGGSGRAPRDGRRTPGGPAAPDTTLRDTAAADTTAPGGLRPSPTQRPGARPEQRIGNVLGRPEGGAPGDTSRTQRPTFQRGEGQAFTGERLSFNLRTKRGRVQQARTQAQQQPGFVTGETVKVYEDSTLYVADGSYTTCDCEPGETPSYSLRSDRMKIQDKWVYTGPIQLFLFEVPTPLWLPFGFLPNTQGRRSGPLPPEYGRDRLGIYLRNWGWYFALNDYTDLTLRAGVWSQGSFEVKPRFRYNKRYSYQGNLEVEYVRRRTGEDIDPNPTRSQEGRLRWNHSQTLSPTANFSGDVNLVTSSNYLRDNATSYNDAVTQQISSSINYRKRWPGGNRSVSINANQSQQLSDGSANVTLPTLRFTQGNFKPFSRETQIGGERWYERITTDYDMTFENRYRFSRRNEDQLLAEGDTAAANAQWYDALFNPDLYRRATGRNEPPLSPTLQHSTGLRASFRVNRFNMSVSPSIPYESDWYVYTKRLEQVQEPLEDDPDTPEDESDSTRTVERTRNVQGFYARHDFRSSLSASTEVFGLFPVKAGPFRGLLHRVSPNLSLNYAPNFNDPRWGRTRRLKDAQGNVVRDERGDPVLYDILSGSRTSRGNQTFSTSFNIRNEFETKRVRVDSTGTETEDRIKFLNLDVRSAYNFAADSLRLSPFDLTARTDIAQKFNVNLSMTLDPYSFTNTAAPGEREQFRKVSEYLAAETPWKPVRLTNLSLSVSGDFRSSGSGSLMGGRGGGQGSQIGSMRGMNQMASRGRQNGFSGPGEAELAQAYRTMTGYPKFNTPWSLNFRFQYRLRKQFDDPEPDASVRLDASFALTPKWQIGANTSYDIIENKLSQTNINVNRDLGCWVMSFGWAPFGVQQGYAFSLQVKQSMLADLLRLNIPRSGDSGFFRDLGSRVGSTAAGAAGAGGLGGGGRSFGGGRF